MLGFGESKPTGLPPTDVKPTEAQPAIPSSSIPDSAPATPVTPDAALEAVKPFEPPAQPVAATPADSEHIIDPTTAADADKSADNLYRKIQTETWQAVQPSPPSTEATPVPTESHADLGNKSEIEELKDQLDAIIQAEQTGIDEDKKSIEKREGIIAKLMQARDNIHEVDTMKKAGIQPAASETAMPVPNPDLQPAMQTPETGIATPVTPASSTDLAQAT